MKLRVDTFLIKLQFLLLAGITVTQVLNKPSISSMLFMLTFLVTLAFWFLTASRRISKTDILMSWIIVLSFVSVAINAIITDANVSFNYVKKLIMFWTTLIFLSSMRVYKPNHEVVQFIFRVNALMAIFLIGMHFLQHDQMYTWNRRVTDYLLFRFTNPNLTAIFLSGICIIELLSAYRAGKRKWKIFHTGLASIVAWFVIKTQCRNAQLLLAAFLMVYVFMLLFTRNRLRMKKWMAVIISVFPAVFAIMYMLYIYTPGVQNLFAFLIGEGKKLDSRVIAWTIGFQTIADSPIIGAYQQLYAGLEWSHLHNSHLDVAASYGVPVLVLLCIFLYRILTEQASQSRMQFVCLVGVTALLMTGIGEAMVFSGGLGVYIFLGVILMLSNYDFENKKLCK